MAMSVKCAGCGELTSFLCAAQFRKDGQHLIVCADCWAAGKRCFAGPEGLVVATEPPSTPAEQPVFWALHPVFWDEGHFVTGGNAVFEERIARKGTKDE